MFRCLKVQSLSRSMLRDHQRSNVFIAPNCFAWPKVCVNVLFNTIQTKPNCSELWATGSSEIAGGMRYNISMLINSVSCF